MSSFDSVQAFYVLLFYSFFLLIVLLLWHFFWLKPYPMNLPTPEHLHLSNPNFETKIENLWDGVKYLYYVVFKRYDQSFWMHHCGFEAFGNHRCLCSFSLEEQGTKNSGIAHLADQGIR